MPQIAASDKFKDLKKETSCKLYLYLHQKLQINKKLLKMCSLLISNKCKTKHWNSLLLRGKAKPNMNQNLEKNKVFSEKVRGSNLLPLKQKQSNLIPGSSIIGELESDATISLDTAIHAYRGLTAKEKIKDVEKYKCKKLNLFSRRNRRCLEITKKLQ